MISHHIQTINVFSRILASRRPCLNFLDIRTRHDRDDSNPSRLIICMIKADAIRIASIERHRDGEMVTGFRVALFGLSVARRR